MNGESNHGQTHYLECWREPGHHRCAIAEIKRLRARLEQIEEGIEALGKKYEAKANRSEHGI